MTMMGSPTVVINPARRILKMPGAVCGGIRTGTDKIRSGYGNGDCLFFDFEHLVFAVADGSERFPGASRDLLSRLSDSLSLSGSPVTVQGWRDMLNTKIFSEQKYQHKTTFSCVAIRREGEDLLLIISHGGDSAVTVMNSTTGSICRQTGRDMNFAGRSKEIADVTEYRMADRDGRVLISTDGFDDVWRFRMRQSIFGGAREVFERHPVDGMCEMIHGVLEESRGLFEYDDIGFIMMDPYRTERIGGTAVIMGGTQPSREKKYLSECASGLHDRWVSEGQWGDYNAVFAWAGIQVLGQRL
jgi:hypothetical protein